jgi:hypothetical protein
MGANDGDRLDLGLVQGQEVVPVDQQHNRFLGRL